MTLHVAHPFDPCAPCPRWLQFLQEVFDNDADLADFIPRAVGYSLTGDTSEQSIYFCLGRGANGKSRFFAGVRYVLGPYAYDAPFSTFEASARATIPNDLAALGGRRFVTVSETAENMRLNEARIKALSGCDPITARFLNQEFFTFTPTCKLWLAVNHKPRVTDDSLGFWRRVKLIPFTRTFQGADDDKHLDEKLRAEAQGILAWAVRGTLEWQQRGLEPPNAVRAATDEYRTESDPLAEFMSARCVQGEQLRVTASGLYKAYAEWAKATGLRDRDTLSI
jgi:putative DNA primase/helicase